MKKQDQVIGDMDIAIIGMDGRFPMAENIDQFWENIRSGRNCIWEGTIIKPNYVSTYGKIDRMYSFDYEFFHVNQNDAYNMDPQFRIVMECVYKALEDAGYAGDGGDRSIGLFLGADENYYVWNNYYARKSQGKEFERVPMFLQNTLSSNISYKLNLQGPSIVMRAACATSLVTVHYAIQSLLNYDCNMAVAGGVNIREDDNGYIVIDGVSSPTGRLRAYDEEGDGYVPGNGMGVVVLKRAEDAIADKDRIYAIIKGSAVLNDGNRKAGYHASSVQGEAEAIRRAMTIAEAKPADIQYIEGHGTATPLGDRVEIQAIDKAYSSFGTEYHCELGAVKANIGHLNVAAGIASLIKTVLSLYYGEIAPAVHYERPNPELLRIHERITIPVKGHPWKKDVLRMAGVSSFGFGGADAHMVLSEAPERKPCEMEKEWYLIPYSAIDKQSLLRNRQETEAYMENKKFHPYEFAYTMQTGKRHMDWRGYFLINQDAAILCREEKETACQEVARQIYLESGQDAVIQFVSTILPEAECVCLSEEDILQELSQNPEKTYIRIQSSRKQQGSELAYANMINIIGTCDNEQEKMKLAGALYLAGANLDWNALYEEKPYKTGVPLYQFTQNEIKEIEKLVIAGTESAKGAKESTQPVQGEQSVESTLLEIVREALNISDLEADETIFEYDLDSLTILMLNADIKKQFLVDIDISSLYELETIEAIAGYIEEQPKETEGIEKADSGNSLYELSPGQRNMWFLYQYKKQDFSYISRYTLTVKGEQRLDLIEEAFYRLVKRHPVLRTIYPVIGGVPQQMVCEPSELKPSGIYQVAGMGQEEREDFIYQKTLINFDLENEIPMKFCIFKNGPEETILMIIFHHIAHDGWSMGIFMREFYMIYESLRKQKEPELMKLPYDYIDYCKYLIDKADSQESKMEFWNRHFAGEVSELPFAIIEENKREENGNLIRRVSSETVKKLHQLASEWKVTSNEIYFAAYGILMYEVTGKASFNVGTPVLNRNQKEFYDIIGYFSNTAVYHFQIEEQTPVKEYITGIHGTMLDMLGKYQIPLEDLVKHLVKGKLQKDKLFNVMYSYQGQTQQNACLRGVTKIDGTSFQTAQFNHKYKASTDFAMTFHVIEGEEGVDVGIGFQGMYFTWEQVGKLLDGYLGILEHITEAQTIQDVLEETYQGIVTLSKPEQKEAIEATEKSSITDTIYQIWKQILGEIPYELDKPYFSLGGTSFNSFQALKEMNKVYDTDISITDFFRYSTIAELAALVEEQSGIVTEETEEMNNMMF